LLAQDVTALRGKVSNFAKEAIEYFRTLAEVDSEEPIVKDDLKAIWCVSFIFKFLYGY
jgi:hypothetical protein